MTTTAPTTATDRFGAARRARSRLAGGVAGLALLLVLCGCDGTDRPARSARFRDRGLLNRPPRADQLGERADSRETEAPPARAPRDAAADTGTPGAEVRVVRIPRDGTTPPPQPPGEEPS
ncbi:MAG: hypothetical protein ACOCX4_04825, partial [Planctomycetota bacterium]